MKRFAPVAATMIVAFLGFTAPAWAAPPGDNGTIKVYDKDTNCTGDSQANDPKVTSPFWVGGTGFDPNQPGSLTIETQPGGEPVYGPDEFTTDANGDFCRGEIRLVDGRYKIVFTISDATGKQKVITAYGTAITPNVTFIDPTCENGNQPVVVIAPEPGVDDLLVGDLAPGGWVVVTVSPEDGYLFSEGSVVEWSHQFPEAEACPTPTPTQTITPAPALTEAAVDQSPPELAATGLSANAIGTLVIGLALLATGSTILYMSRRKP